MTHRHTPGPWLAKIPQDGNSYMPIRGGRLGTRFKIANVLNEQGLQGVGEQVANARLIAAAPEMLRAIESLILFVKPTQSNAAALNNAMQVIVKATGGDV